MLADSITKAFDRADSLVTMARVKAAELPAVFGNAGVSNVGDGSSISIGGAAEQYRHNLGWVYAAVTLICQRVAAQNIHVARVSSSRRPDSFATKQFLAKGMADNLEPVDAHAILDLLHDPNELGTAWTLMAMTVANLELTGRALWYVDRTGDKSQIMSIPTGWIQKVDRARTTWEIRLPRAAKPIPLPGDQCVYFFYPDPSDPWGALSPLSAIAAGVLADESISETQWRVFKQGQNPGVVLTVGKLPAPPGGGESMRPTLTAEQRKQLITSIVGAYSGVHRVGQPIILDGMIESVTKLSFTPQELDFLNSAKLTKSRILQGYRTSPILLGEVEGANRASATVADEIFVANKVNPLITLLSQTMTEWLGPMFAAAGERLVVWIEEAVAKDEELALKKWGMAVGKGLCTTNEFRRAVLNLPDVPGGDALEIGEAKTPQAETTDAAGEVVAAGSDIQATALNGAQIDSLVQICQLVTSGEISRDAAKALIRAAFPLLPSETVDSIVDALEPGQAAIPAEVVKSLNPYTLRRLSLTNGHASR